MKSVKVKRIIMVSLLAAIAVLSFFVVAEYSTSIETNAQVIETLDEKKSTVLKLTAASTAVSAAMTALPGDIASPIATEIAELSTYFLIVVSTIYLEKYLVTITGFAAYYILVPAGCIAGIISILTKKRTMGKIAEKLILFGLAISIVIPASVKVSELIDEAYGASIEQTIEAAVETSDELTDAAESDESSTALGKIINGIKDGASGMTDKLSSILNNFIESVAVMIVTSCIIPILVLLFFIWLIKILLGVNIGIPHLRHRDEKKYEEK